MSDDYQENEDDDYLYDEPQLSEQPSISNSKVLELQDVKKIIKKTIESVMDKCFVGQDNAIELLQYYDWRDDLVEQNYFQNQDELLKNLRAKGILNDHSQITYLTEAQQACPVCLEENYVIQLGCLHKFCESCIESTIQQKVKKEHSLIIRCLQDGCLYRMPYSMIEKYCKPQDLSNVLCRRFVENSPNLAYCTGCNKILQNHNPSETKVICSCQNEFCFRCKSDFHSPAPCDIVKKWIQQITKDGDQIKKDYEDYITKEEDQITQDEANIKWIARNTKICPFCKKPIEKSSGCNQLHCNPPGGCGQTFCYICGNPWEPDPSDHLRCKKYVAPKYYKEKEKGLLTRYNFYHERFLNSEENYWQVKDQLKQLRNSIIFYIFDIYEVTQVESQFIEESLQELLLSRRVLKWSYCYNFFLQQSNSTSNQALKNYEDKFEFACEKLAISLARFFEKVDKYTYLYDRNINPLNIRKTEFQKMKNRMRKQLAKTISYRKTLEDAMGKGEIGL